MCPVVARVDLQGLEQRVLCGLVSSLVVVGMIALGFQMLPISAKFITFDRCPELNDSSEDRNLFPNVDGFVVGLMNVASNSCFAGENKPKSYNLSPKLGL